MKKILPRLLSAALLCAGVSLDARELKVLMIGNSFSASVLQFLPQIVQHSGKHKLKLANAYIGGCTLKRHCENIDAEQSRPESAPYTLRIPGTKPAKKKLSDIIKSDKWDIISIQQGSSHSPYKEQTQAYAKKLIAHVKKLAPQAEIVVHQTWAYRADHPWFTGKKPKMTQKQMYEMVTANYTELAAANKLRMIPVGNAVHLYREKLPVKPPVCTPAELKSLEPPRTIDITGGDVVGRMWWGTNRKTGAATLGIDRIHLNRKGAYLQGCVWYLFLFDAKPEEIKCDFKGPEEKLLRACAAEALAALKK